MGLLRSGDADGAVAVFLDVASRKASAPGAASQSSELLDTAVMGLVDAVLASVGTAAGFISSAGNSAGGGGGGSGSGGFSPEALAALDAMEAAPALLSLEKLLQAIGDTTSRRSAVQRLSDAFAALALDSGRRVGVGSGGSDLAAPLAALTVTSSYFYFRPKIKYFFRLFFL